jgi:beta-galactosidase
MACNSLSRAHTYDGTYQSLYVNGELVGVFNPVMPYVHNLAMPLRLGAEANESWNGNYLLLGGLDEAAVYGTALPQTAVANHYAAAFTTPPTVVTAPYFAAPPPNTTNQIGAAIRLDAIAYGGVPMQYQWLKDGAPLPGETNFVLTIPSATYSDSGYYQLSATNAAGGVVSDQGYLQTLPPSAPVITVDLPTTLNVYPGGSPKLQVNVAGSAPFTYLWTSNGVALY